MLSLNTDLFQRIAADAVAVLQPLASANNVRAQKWIAAISKAAIYLPSCPWAEWSKDTLLIASPQSNDVHEASRETCDCTAFRNNSPCWHRAGAKLMYRYDLALTDEPQAPVKTTQRQNNEYNAYLNGLYVGSFATCQEARTVLDELVYHQIKGAGWATEEPEEQHEGYCPSCGMPGWSGLCVGCEEEQATEWEHRAKRKHSLLRSCPSPWLSAENARTWRYAVNPTLSVKSSLQKAAAA